MSDMGHIWGGGGGRAEFYIFFFLELDLMTPMFSKIIYRLKSLVSICWIYFFPPAHCSFLHIALIQYKLTSFFTYEYDLLSWKSLFCNVALNVYSASKKTLFGTTYQVLQFIYFEKFLKYLHIELYNMDNMHLD